MKSLKFIYIILFVSLFIFGGFFFGDQGKVKFNLVLKPVPISIDGNRVSAQVLKVIDGDTIRVLINNKEDTVRLIGIDSPEIVDERKPVQCFGKESSGKAKEVLNGKAIILESDSTQSDRDEYGRLLRYVFLDSLNFNKLMISEGYAREYTFKGRSYKYQAEFVRMEKEARESKKGLWSSLTNCGFQ